MLNDNKNPSYSNKQDIAKTQKEKNHIIISVNVENI